MTTKHRIILAITSLAVACPVLVGLLRGYSARVTNSQKGDVQLGSDTMKAQQVRRGTSRGFVEQLESRHLLSGSAERAIDGVVGADVSVGDVVLSDVAPSTQTTATPAAVAVVAAESASPMLLHTQADFDRMVAKVAAGQEPWLSGWNALTADGYSQLGANPRPLQTVIRGGTGQNFAQMYIDIARTYQCALRWKISGDTRYADQAVTFLNAWSSTMTTLTGNSDRFLASGLYGYTWAVAADIMKSYQGWAAEDVTRFQNYLVNIYYPMQHDFLVNHNTASITNYWANWDLANIEGMMAIGIVAGRQDLYDEAMTYLHQGGGNGALDKIVYFMHPGHLAQWQESGRDQGHTLLGMQLFGHIAQMAWNQGDDLLSYNNYQFLAAAEYIAKYNLGNDVPYEAYYWGTGQKGTWSSQTAIGSGSRGNRTAGYELIYAHYVNRLGMAAPYTTQRVMSLRPEGRVTNGDGFGFGTLTFALDPYAGAQQPRGLTAAERGAGNVQLDWYGSSAGTSYNVYRATGVDGTYARVASGIIDLLTYTDTGLPAGTYYYKVTAVVVGGESGPSNVVRATSTTLPHTRLAFDATTGTAAADATGNGHEGTLNGGTAWGAGRLGNAVSLDGVDDYVSLPTGVAADLADFTISAWVNLANAATWSRVFDFGDDRGRWMFLTPRNSNGVAEFSTSTTYGYNKQSVVGTAALPTNGWVHVAVTLSAQVGTLYVNGVAVGSNPGMTFPPAQIGATTRNWIGRSQFSSDPYLAGKVDDFRVYRGAMPADQIATLATAALPAVPTSLRATVVSTSQIDLAWTDEASNETGYVVERATNPAFTAGLTAATVGANVTSYAVIGLSVGTTYYFRVRGTNVVGDSENSTAASATTQPANTAPTIATPVAVSPNPPGSTATLSVLGADNGGEANLRYTWSATSLPTGAAAPTFSVNGTNAAKATTVRVTKAGAYTFAVTIADAAGLTATSSVSVNVSFGMFTDTQDIGSPAVAGSVGYNAATGMYTVIGGGSDIWAGSDQFRFVRTSFIAADGDLVARVASVGNSNVWAKAGVMFRNGSAANAAFAMVVVTPGSGVSFQTRSSAGAAASSQTVVGVKAPIWVRLRRSGANTFSAYYSSNGSTWTQLGASRTVTMPTSIAAGLAVTSHNNATTTTAAFGNVSLQAVNRSAVQSLLVNDGAAQRSMGTSVTATFSEPVTLAANSFTLTRRPTTAGGAATATAFLIRSLDGGRSYRLTFPASAGGSLGDGVYDLRVNGGSVISLSGWSMGVVVSASLHRLFGDADGSGAVDDGDYAAFRLAYGAGVTGYNAVFDYNADGFVNGTDFIAFRARYGTSVAR